MSTKIPYDSDVDKLVRNMINFYRNRFGHIEAYDVSNDCDSFHVIYSSLQNIHKHSIKMQILCHKPSGYHYVLQTFDNDTADDDNIRKQGTRIHFATLKMPE